MASPPVDPVVHLPVEDAFKISARDMLILRDAIHYKNRAESLELEIVSLRQQLEKEGN